MFSTDLANETLSRVVASFSENTFAETLAKQLIIAPELPCANWSLCNRFIMALHGTGDARGFNQWREVYRYPRKGSKAFYILAPVLRPAFAPVKVMVDGQEKTEIRRVQGLVGFRCVPVFRVEDTDGKALEQYKPREYPPLVEVAKAWGLEVRYARISNAYGAYDRTAITLSTEDQEDFFHELAHAAHDRIEKLKGGQHREQEAIAELSAAVLSRLYGHNYDSGAWQYLAYYAGEKTPEAVGRLCLSVLSKVEKVLKLILETKPALPIPIVETQQ